MDEAGDGIKIAERAMLDAESLSFFYHFFSWLVFAIDQAKTRP